MPLHVSTSSTEWRSKRCLGIGFLARADREIGVFRYVAQPTRLCLEFLRETGLILRCNGKVQTPSKENRRMDPTVKIRREEWAQMK